MVPAIAAATLKALEIVQGEPERRDQLNANIAYFRHEALQLGLPLSESATPIQPLILGDETRTLSWALQLQQKSIQVGAIRPPTVPKGESRLRVTLSARHQHDDIDQLLAALHHCQHQEALCSPFV